jgi:hypothetical protein
MLLLGRRILAEEDLELGFRCLSCCSDGRPLCEICSEPRELLGFVCRSLGPAGDVSIEELLPSDEPDERLVMGRRRRRLPLESPSRIGWGITVSRGFGRRRREMLTVDSYGGMAESECCKLKSRWVAVIPWYELDDGR